MPIKDARSICKTIMRNGFDAYVIGPNLQREIHLKTGIREISIGCATDYDTLSKLFPLLEESDQKTEIAKLYDAEREITYRFYDSSINECAPTKLCAKRVTQKMLDDLYSVNKIAHDVSRGNSSILDSDKVFCSLKEGHIKFEGIPLFALENNYSYAIKALRMAANYEIPIEQNTWVAIVQSAKDIYDYVSPRIFMEEWRLVAAESMWKFIELLAKSKLLFEFIPEFIPLTELKQNINKDRPEEQTILDHTIECMKHYPEESLHHDWIGTISTLFHEIGKAQTAEYFEGNWYFFQHHRIGASITRSILRRLYFEEQEIETICNIVRNHVRFQSMMTDRGIRQFMEYPDQERIIEISRAIIKANPDGNYTNFNHNLKYMERGDKPLSMLEPLLNGNEIMEHTSLPPGPKVGILREALLNAQILGEVSNTEQAIAFVKKYMIKLL